MRSSSASLSFKRCVRVWCLSFRWPGHRNPAFAKIWCFESFFKSKIKIKTVSNLAETVSFCQKVIFLPKNMFLPVRSRSMTRQSSHERVTKFYWAIISIATIWSNLHEFWNNTCKQIISIKVIYHFNQSKSSSYSFYHWFCVNIIISLSSDQYDQFTHITVVKYEWRRRRHQGD